MKNILLSGVLIGGLSLAACQNFPNLPDLTTLSSLIKNDAQAICAVEPTADTIGAIVAAYVPGAAPIEQVAAQIAKQICTAVNSTPPVTQAGRLRGQSVNVPVIVVNGKSIEVHVVRR